MPDRPAPDVSGDPDDAAAVEPETPLGDPELREQWARLIDDVDDGDVTPTVIGLHALLDDRLPIIDIDPATGPWTMTRTSSEPVRRCHADASLTAVVALRQHDASGPTLGTDVFVSLQTDIADMAPADGWQLTTVQPAVRSGPSGL